jgi:curved DNA-binding protein CbpA
MFTDYYALLEIEPIASDEEIEAAFKERSSNSKWELIHSVGYTSVRYKLQLNEALDILLNKKKREEYDVKYLQYKKHQQEQEKRFEYYKTELGLIVPDRPIYIDADKIPIDETEQVVQGEEIINPVEKPSNKSLSNIVLIILAGLIVYWLLKSCN